MNQSTTGFAKTVTIGLAMGWGLTIGITLIGSVVLSVLILNGAFTWEKLGYGIMTVILLSAFAGATMSAGIVKHRRLVICILSGVIYLLSLLGITALFFDGKFEAVWITSILIIGGSLCAALVHCAEKKGNGKTRRKRRL